MYTLYNVQCTIVLFDVSNLIDIHTTHKIKIPKNKCFIFLNFHNLTKLDLILKDT